MRTWSWARLCPLRPFPRGVPRLLVALHTHPICWGFAGATTLHRSLPRAARQLLLRDQDWPPPQNSIHPSHHMAGGVFLHPQGLSATSPSVIRGCLARSLHLSLSVSPPPSFCLYLPLSLSLSVSLSLSHLCLSLSVCASLLFPLCFCLCLSLFVSPTLVALGFLPAPAPGAPGPTGSLCASLRSGASPGSLSR